MSEDLKATEWKQLTLNNYILRNTLHSFYQPRKDERLCGKRRHLVVLDAGFRVLNPVP